MIFDHVTICHLRYLMVVPSSRNLETRLLGTCVQPVSARSKVQRKERSTSVVPTLPNQPGATVP